MTTNTATMTDCTWAAMEAAGLDTDRVARLNADSDRDTWEYLSEDGATRVNWGPAADDAGDPDGETNLGWNITTWERYELAGESYWDVTGYDWQESAADTLTSVKAAVDA